jgi:hypothetical protein
VFITKIRVGKQSFVISDFMGVSYLKGPVESKVCFIAYSTAADETSKCKNIKT